VLTRPEDWKRTGTMPQRQARACPAQKKVVSH
jgi:hypothetical protein